ncbi:MAG: response regulator [Fimbriimonas sp.]|nr:response regulator [Fimbriimonas sp.]
MPSNRQKTRLLISFAYGLGCLALLAVALATFSSSNRFMKSAERFEAATKQIQLASDIEGILTRAESEQRGYLITLKSDYLRSFDEDSVAFLICIRKLKDAAKGTAKLEKTVERVESLGTRKIEVMHRVITTARSRGADAGSDMVRGWQGLHLMDDVRSEIKVLRQDLEKHLSELAIENESNRSASQTWLIGGLVIATLAVLGAALLLMRDLASRIEIENSLQQANALQSAIFDSVGSAIIATDTHGTITIFNRTAEEWLGYSSAEVVGAKDPTIFVDRSELEARAALLSRDLHRKVSTGFETLVAKARSGTFDSNEWTYVSKDGTRFPIVLTISAVKDVNGNLLGFVGMANDLTEQKKTQSTLDTYVREIEAANQLAYQQNRELKRTAEELKESRDSAVAATRMKSEFLANMSHEIRTPMNGVIGMAHLLLNTPLTEKQQGYARTVRESAESLLAILNDILDLSKMEAGKMTLENFPFDLRLMLEDLCDVMAPTAHVKGLELNCVIPPGITSRVVGDPSRLRQILTNLLGNAIKFTERGEVSIQVSVLKDNPKRVTYRLAVVDTGIGIPADRQAKIFDSFTQADGTTTRKFGGTGLGLTISKQLAELMGGEIGVKSTVGKGSEFWLEVAFKKQAAPKVDVEEVSKNFPEIRVLVADDNATNRFILREMLQSWNCRVEEATNGTEALSAIALSTADPFSTVIMDLHMPGMDGLQAARTIKRDVRFKELPLILLSSSGFNPPDTESASLYAAVLSKPVRNSPLYNALSQVTGIVPKAEPERKDNTDVGQVLKGVRILVVEDNPVNQMVVSELLDMWGCNVVTANNGLMAVDATAKEKFDAILMDVQMPVMDGFEATAVIRTQEQLTQSHTEIIAMTANAMTGDKERCLSAGMDSYLSKPLQPALLLEKLTAATGRHVAETLHRQAPEPKRDSSFDLKRLDESCSGSSSLKLKVIDRYLATSVDSVSQIERSISSIDHKGVRAAAHALKGSSFTIGANRVGTICQDLETLAVNEQIDDKSGALATELSHEMVLLHEDLRSYIDGLSKAEA